MNDDIKKKLKFVLVTVLILLIPSYFLFSYAYGDYLNDKALNLMIGSHPGYTEKEAMEQAVKYLERAKQFRRKNYIITYNQAQLYLKLGDFKKAEQNLYQILEIRPELDKGYLYYGIALELNHQPDSAKVLYKIYRQKVDEEFQVSDPDSRNPEEYRAYRLVLDFLLNDDSAYHEDLNLLKTEYPENDTNEIQLKMQSDKRKEFLLEHLGIIKAGTLKN